MYVSIGDIHMTWEEQQKKHNRQFWIFVGAITFGIIIMNLGMYLMEIRFLVVRGFPIIGMVMLAAGGALVITSPYVSNDLVEILNDREGCVGNLTGCKEYKHE